MRSTILKNLTVGIWTLHGLVLVGLVVVSALK